MGKRVTQKISDKKKLVHQPFYSIIIATYNRSKLLRTALDSLISQTEDDWEAIIVDDGSTDDTYQKVSPYLKSYPNIKYIKKDHSGVSKSKNEGISASAGKFISFLDSDDEYDPRHLETRKNILMGNLSIKFLYGGAKILGNQFVPDRFNYNIKVNLRDCVIGGTFFIEKTAFSQLNGFKNIELGSDADLFDRAKKSGLNMKETNIPTYIYHHETDDSITNKFYSFQNQISA
jgi:glycosyltransferase involved in cell wall biosynthesis